MSLFSDWQDLAQQQRSQTEHDRFWNEYFDAETENYKKILDDRDTPYTGKLCELAKTFNMDDVVFTGFLDGINTSLKTELVLEDMEPESEISLEVDLEKLYFNMLNAKASWLYGLPQWDDILTPDRKKEITKEYRASITFVNAEHIGRNDPCPCGSGKKYKKCCGKDK